jgi:PAS domain S-box-containing protein
MTAKALEAYFRTAFDHAPVGMAIVTRRSHQIVSANQALGDLLGVEPEDLVGHQLNDFRERRTGEVPLPADPATGEIPTFSGERACRRQDGTTVWLEVHSSVLPENAEGRSLCLVHVVDISRRRAAEADRDRRQAWASALGEIRLAVLLGSAPADSLSLVCRRARILLAASDAVVITPTRDGDGATVEAADGHDAQALVDASFPLPGTLAAEVLSAGRAVVTGPDGEPHAVIDGRLPARRRAAVLALPLRTPDVVIGVLCLVRPPGEPFSRSDIDVARSFADQAAAALHIGELRADRERLRVLEDRERIARDLHDSVIQDLFAAGMALDAVQPLIGSQLAAERVATTIDQLDATIKQIRSTIFELETSDPGERGTDLLRRVVDSRSEQLGFSATLELDGRLDAAPPALVDHVLAIVSEGLSNIARHAEATSAGVRVRASREGGLTVTVWDDGSGFDPQRAPRGNGLANMRRRAELLSATLRITSTPGAGTRLLLETPPLTRADPHLQVPTTR